MLLNRLKVVADIVISHSKTYQHLSPKKKNTVILNCFEVFMQDPMKVYEQGSFFFSFFLSTLVLLSFCFSEY